MGSGNIQQPCHLWAFQKNWCVHIYSFLKLKNRDQESHFVSIQGDSGVFLVSVNSLAVRKRTSMRYTFYHFRHMSQGRWCRIQEFRDNGDNVDK
jgi:hypothetical protein